MKVNQYTWRTDGWAFVKTLEVTEDLIRVIERETGMRAATARNMIQSGSTVQGGGWKYEPVGDKR